MSTSQLPFVIFKSFKTPKAAPKEIDAVLQARTPMGAAKRYIARTYTRPAHPNGISLKTVNSCYSRYFKSPGVRASPSNSNPLSSHPQGCHKLFLASLKFAKLILHSKRNTIPV